VKPASEVTRAAGVGEQDGGFGGAYLVTIGPSQVGENEVCLRGNVCRRLAQSSTRKPR
jgi:hypothetical protein